MTIEDALYAELAAYAGLAALVSTRIYPMRLPEDATLPGVIYYRMSAGRESDCSGATGLARPTFRVQVWADDYKEAHTVATQVRKALDGNTSQWGGESGAWASGRLVNDVDLMDPDLETPAYGVAMDFEVWHWEA